jgi:magnesium-transporting ATPase (P-type)
MNRPHIVAHTASLGIRPARLSPRSLRSRLVARSSIANAVKSDPSDSLDVSNVCCLDSSGTFVDVSHLAERLGCSVDHGLTENAVHSNRRDFGSNRLPESRAVTFLEHMREALEDFTLLILLGSAAVSLILWAILDEAKGPGWIDGVAILTAVAVVVLVSATTNHQRDIQFRHLSAEEQNIKVRNLDNSFSLNSITFMMWYVELCNATPFFY